VTRAAQVTAGLVAEQPLHERACWLHMVALHRSGRTAEALEVFAEHRRLLDTELGLDVGAALRDLQGAVLRQDPEVLRWPGPGPEGPGRPESAGTPGVVEPERAGTTVHTTAPAAPGSGLVGRHRELGVLTEVLHEARTDGPRWLVLTGEAGIGKSRLAEEAVARWLADGGRVSRTGCPDDDGVPPWWPVRQLLRDLGSDPDGVLTPPLGVDADATRFATYERVVRDLERATATTPLLVLVDDLHWADETSLRFLTHLAQTWHRTGLAVVATVRDGAGGSSVARLQAALARRPGTRQLAVPPLSAREVATLASTISADALDAAELGQLVTQTGGNPFFVSEYARLPAEERRTGQAPVAVRSVLGRRLGGLDPAVLQVLRTAAVMGDVLDIGLLARATRLDPDDLADLLDEAADERIIVPAPGTGEYVFAHALLRDEVVAGLSGVRRQRTHLRIAEAIGPVRDGDLLSRRAGHLLAAMPLVDAAETLDACRAAALDAEQRWESESAAQWWEQALRAAVQLPTTNGSSTHGPGLGGTIAVDRDDLLINQVSALARAGRGQTVLDVLDAALFDAVRAGRTASAGRLAATLLRTSGAWPWITYGDDPSGVLTRLAAVQDRVRDDPAAHVRVLAALGVGSCYDPDGAVPDRLSARAIEEAERHGDPDVLADALLGRALTFAGVAERAQESVALLDRLAALPHRLEQLDGVLRHNLLTMAAMTLAPETVHEHLRLGAAGSDLLRLPVSRVQLRWAEGVAAHWVGDFTGARRRYDQAFELHRQTELYQASTHDIAMVTLGWDTGELAGLDLATTNPRQLPWGPALAAAARGEIATADRLLAAELARVEPVRWTTHGRLTGLAHAAADVGLRPHAAELRARLAPFAPFVATVGQVGVFGPVALALARICALDGDLAAARAFLDQAADIAVRSGGRPSAVRCRLVRAQLDRQAGRDVPAATVRAIMVDAEALGMATVARAAAALTG
jgi:hypothetical protein